MIKFHNKNAEERFKEAEQWAKSHRLQTNWEENIERLKTIAKNTRGELQMSIDFAPLSLCWAVVRENGSCSINGGLIYHGPHDNGGDGSFPTLSVSLSPSTGWQIHT